MKIRHELVSENTDSERKIEWSCSLEEDNILLRCGNIIVLAAETDGVCMVYVPDLLDAGLEVRIVEERGLTPRVYKK